MLFTSEVSVGHVEDMVKRVFPIGIWDIPINFGQLKYLNKKSQKTVAVVVGD
jgi:hypothetical protein